MHRGKDAQVRELYIFQFFYDQCSKGYCCFSSFTIRVPGFGAVVMDLNYICQCDCEKPSMAVSWEYLLCHVMCFTTHLVWDTVRSFFSQCFLLLFCITHPHYIHKLFLYIVYCSLRQEENSTKCSDGNGTFACGQCVCNKGR